MIRPMILCCSCAVCLMEAPDDYAEIRLEADLLLSEKDLSARGATLGERAEALAELLERYRGTAVEANYGPASELNPASISEERYMAQLQSLFIGDFLAAGPSQSTQAPKDPVQPDNPDPYTAFHEKLEQWQQQRKSEL